MLPTSFDTNDPTTYVFDGVANLYRESRPEFQGSSQHLDQEVLWRHQDSHRSR
jgi:hypothetical protein